MLGRSQDEIEMVEHEETPELSSEPLITKVVFKIKQAEMEGVLAGIATYTGKDEHSDGEEDRFDRCLEKGAEILKYLRR